MKAAVGSADAAAAVVEVKFAALSVVAAERDRREE